MARTPKNQALGKALRQAREENGLTLRALAKRLERDPGAVSYTHLTLPTNREV